MSSNRFFKQQNKKLIKTGYPKGADVFTDFKVKIQAAKIIKINKHDHLIIPFKALISKFND